MNVILFDDKIMLDSDTISALASHLSQTFSNVIDEKGLLTRDNLVEIMKEVSWLRRQNYSLMQEVAELRKMVDLSDNRSRRNNVIIGGFKRDMGVSCVETARSFIQNELHMEPPQIVRAFPLTKQESSTKILVELVDHSQVDRLLRRGPHLKNSAKYIQQDLSVLTRKKIAKLNKIKNEIRKKNVSAKMNIVNERLIVNGKIFTWSNEEGLLMDDGGDGRTHLKKLLNVDLEELLQETEKAIPASNAKMK